MSGFDRDLVRGPLWTALQMLTRYGLSNSSKALDSVLFETFSGTDVCRACNMRTRLIQAGLKQAYALALVCFHAFVMSNTI
eukprot:2087587-Heterocapsa_arctica.AAC.1